jgi:hypothetical protein
MILVPTFKIYGAAMINVLSTMILFGLLYYFSKENWGNYFEVYKLFMVFFVGVMIVLVNTLILQEISLLSMGIKFIFCLSFPFLLIPFKFYEKVEIEALLRIPKILQDKIRNR